MKKRVFIVLLCYALSSYGILGSIELAIEGARKVSYDVNLITLDSLMTLDIFLAWGVHLAMSINWIKDNRLGKNVAMVGVVFGVIPFIYTLLISFTSPIGSLSIALFTVLYMLVPVLSCFLLAIYLIMYHSDFEARQSNA